MLTIILSPETNSRYWKMGVQKCAPVFLLYGEIRIVEIDGKSYFVANDIAKALGYSIPKDAVSRHCKGALKRRYLTENGKQEIKIIPEGDLYRLITHSKLPSAERFESWVFDEVLPAIRTMTEKISLLKAAYISFSDPAFLFASISLQSLTRTYRRAMPLVRSVRL